MFQFPGLPSHRLCIHLWILKHYLKCVPAFGNLRIIGYLLLPAAYRSLSRPSSAPSAKAFSLCSFLLDQFNIIAISLECFVVAIQLLLHLKIENFVFSIDSIFALLVFSFQGASCFIFGRSRDRLNILSWRYFFVNNFFRFLQKFFQNSKSP